MATLPQPSPSSSNKPNEDKTVWQHIGAAAEELHKADVEAGEYLAKQVNSAAQGVAQAAGGAANWVGQQAANTAKAGAQFIQANQHAVGAAAVGAVIAGPEGAVVGAYLGHRQDATPQNGGQHGGAAAASASKSTASEAHPSGLQAAAANTAADPHPAVHHHAHHHVQPIEIPAETVVVTATPEPQPELKTQPLDAQIPLEQMQAMELPSVALPAAPKPKHGHWWDKVNPFHHQQHGADAPSMHSQAKGAGLNDPQLVNGAQPDPAVSNFREAQAGGSPSEQVATKLAQNRTASCNGTLQPDLEQELKLK